MVYFSNYLSVFRQSQTNTIFLKLPRQKYATAYRIQGSEFIHSFLSRKKNIDTFYTFNVILFWIVIETL